MSILDSDMCFTTDTITFLASLYKIDRLGRGAGKHALTRDQNCLPMQPQACLGIPSPPYPKLHPFVQSALPSRWAPAERVDEFGLYAW